jgi:hypothetical protein
MNYEKEYINYLISEKVNLDTQILDKYFLNQITFEELIKNLDVTKWNVLSYTKFVKEIKINLFLS